MRRFGALSVECAAAVDEALLLHLGLDEVCPLYMGTIQLIQMAPCDLGAQSARQRPRLGRVGDLDMVPELQ